MNCDKHNFEDLLNLVDFLHEEFKEPNISYYVWPIFDEDHTRSQQDNDELYTVLGKIDEKIFGYGITTGTSDLAGIKGRHCAVQGYTQYIHEGLCCKVRSIWSDNLQHRDCRAKAFKSHGSQD
jgi:hypothetical protein